MDPLKLIMQLRQQGMSQEQMLEYLGKNVPAPEETFRPQVSLPQVEARIPEAKLNLGQMAESLMPEQTKLQGNIPNPMVDFSAQTPESLGSLLGGK